MRSLSSACRRQKRECKASVPRVAALVFRDPFAKRAQSLYLQTFISVSDALYKIPLELIPSFGAVVQENQLIRTLCLRRRYFRPSLIKVLTSSCQGCTVQVYAQQSRKTQIRQPVDRRSTDHCGGKITEIAAKRSLRPSKTDRRPDFRSFGEKHS